MNKPKLVVVGNGMAGVRTLEELRKIAPDLYDITVIGAEPHPNYNRIMLSPVLAGEMTIQDIILNDFDWYRRNGIRLMTGQKIVKIDREARTVQAADGLAISYDRLLLATGSTPFILPVPGSTLPGVHAYRDIADADAMIEAAARYRHAVVIGGGLLGLEAANGLAQRGMAVTVVHLGEWIMERQLDRPAATMLQRALEAKGMKFRLAAHTAELAQGASGRVCAVTLKSGEVLPAELVVMAAGIRPNTALAESAGIQCQRGIVVSDSLQTSDPDIYAVGECANHRGVAYGLVAPLFEQAEVLARQLASDGAAAYQGSVTSTKLKVTGIDVFSAGNFMGGDGCEDIVLSDPSGGVYKRVVIQDDRIVGAVTYGDTADGAWYFQMIKAGEKVAAIRQHLLFGPPHAAADGSHCAATL
jgi:nitrite reductase (NADH) large subunit